ncbi:serine/threonine-protein kinase [Streptomyces sp. GbtcB6]|uniref:serine/threonine-protein kinase n=1 Tax=Streptomyces sp. GbtcB6 TaxID=2824751 RepID=UPI001C3038AE|nr:serine/threonine-protein kinase [Streptomyces sp. GbtcB6]
MYRGTPTSGGGRVVAGRYVLLNRLGSGGMGHVWLAHDMRLECEVALKEIVLRDADERDRTARIARARTEARNAAGLRGHPHVVTVHDVLEHEGLPWIVMEYVPGAIDLQELVARHGPVSPAECARIGLGVLDALTAGHERGVLHRDVKPANILLAPDRAGTPYARVLLTDYGISVQPDAGRTRYTLPSALVGTAGYLAPERATGGPPTPTADLFSLGCTLYFAVEGRGPFERGSQLAEITAVVTEEPDPPVRAGALASVLAAMLAKDPARRTPAAEVEAALSLIVSSRAEAYDRTRTAPGSVPHWGASPEAPDVVSGGPGRDRPSAPPPGHRRRPLPRALRAALAAALGLVLALAGVWWAVAHQGTDSTAEPYGGTVGLARPLKAGDCVVAEWGSGTRFAGTPTLTLDPTCADRAPDGQVMTFVPVASAAEARAQGPAGCEERTRVLRGKLADVRAVAVVPGEAGFEAAGGRVACLVLGAHGPLYGPLDGFRKEGAAFTDVGTMQKRDCLRVPPARTALLVACSGPHDQEVLGFTRLGAGLTLAQAAKQQDEACARDVPPGDYGFDPSVYRAASLVGDLMWKTGAHFVVCTVRKQNGGTMEGHGP